MKNYTSIADLLDGTTDSSPHTSYASSKESEPVKDKLHKQKRDNAEPLANVEVKDHVREVVEHEPTEDIAPYIEHRPEIVKVHKDLEKIGVVSHGSPKFSRQKKLDLPLSEPKIVQGLKAPYKSSLRWLAEYCMYLLKKAHRTLTS